MNDNNFLVILSTYDMNDIIRILSGHFIIKEIQRIILFFRQNQDSNHRHNYPYVVEIVCLIDYVLSNTCAQTKLSRNILRVENLGLE